jgi:hypothetical protein
MRGLAAVAALALTLGCASMGQYFGSSECGLTAEGARIGLLRLCDEKAPPHELAACRDTVNAGADMLRAACQFIPEKSAEGA